MFYQNFDMVSWQAGPVKAICLTHIFMKTILFTVRIPLPMLSRAYAIFAFFEIILICIHKWKFLDKIKQIRGLYAEAYKRLSGNPAD